MDIIINLGEIVIDILCRLTRHDAGNFRRVNNATLAICHDLGVQRTLRQIYSCDYNYVEDQTPMDDLLNKPPINWEPDEIVKVVKHSKFTNNAYRVSVNVYGLINTLTRVSAQIDRHIYQYARHAEIMCGTERVYLQGPVYLLPTIMGDVIDINIGYPTIASENPLPFPTTSLTVTIFFEFPDDFDTASLQTQTLCVEGFYANRPNVDVIHEYPAKQLVVRELFPQIKHLSSDHWIVEISNSTLRGRKHSIIMVPQDLTDCIVNVYVRYKFDDGEVIHEMNEQLKRGDLFGDDPYRRLVFTPARMDLVHLGTDMRVCVTLSKKVVLLVGVLRDNIIVQYGTTAIPLYRFA